MKGNWKQVRRGDEHPGYAGLYVTLNQKGHFSINRVTWLRMDSPEAFQLFYDSANSRIALKPSAKAGRDAYPACSGGRNGSRRVHAARLLNECEIDLPATVRFYDAEIDNDGVLILDLRTARVPPSVIAQQRRLDRIAKRNGSPPAP